MGSSRTNQARWLMGTMLPLLYLCLEAMLVPCAAAVIEDSMAERAKPCAACHGKEGRASPDGFYPRIAGKPKGYLFNRLVAIRDATPSDGAMAYLLHGMPDAYLKDFATYFAAMDIPYDTPPQPKVDAATLEEGRHIVQEGDASNAVPACVSCHGQRLVGVEPAVPGLVGIPIGYLSSQLGAWRAGVRHAPAPDCMAQIAVRLNPREVTAAIAWISAQTPPANARPDPRASVEAPMDCGSFHAEGSDK
jgi:cytochrome c553